MTAPIAGRARGAARVLAAAGAISAACVLFAACAASETEPPPGTGLPPGLEYVPPAPGSYALPPIQDAVDGAVVDADGTPRRLFDYMRGRYVLLSFVYTRCTDVEGCPLATGILAMVAEGLASSPQLAAATRLITLSFDPEHDSPQSMRDYALHGGGVDAAKPWATRPWVFLTTTSAQALQPILDGYGQSIVREIDAAGKPTGNFSHVLKVFLIDRQLRVRNIYSTSFLHPAVALNDLETLRLEDTAAR